VNRVSGAEVDYHDAVGVVRLSGEVDIVQAQDLRGRLLGAVRNEDLGLVVDLTEATYIDSVGVSLLFELADRLAGRQLRLAVVLPEGGLVERVLRIVNLASVAEVHGHVGDALSAIRAA
jgi:anti-anti-sigma factor